MKSTVAYLSTLFRLSF